jgi:hypothetical protein
MNKVENSRLVTQKGAVTDLLIVKHMTEEGEKLTEMRLGTVDVVLVTPLTPNVPLGTVASLSTRTPGF